MSSHEKSGCFIPLYYKDDCPSLPTLLIIVTHGIVLIIILKNKNFLTNFLTLITTTTSFTELETYEANGNLEVRRHDKNFIFCNVL